MSNINLEFCEDGSLPTINLGKSIDNLTDEDKQQLIHLAIKKLSFGGTLIIEGIHLNSIAKDYLFGNGLNKELLLNLKSITDLSELQKTLVQNKLKIQNIQLIDGRYHIEATK